MDKSSKVSIFFRWSTHIFWPFKSRKYQQRKPTSAMDFSFIVSGGKASDVGFNVFFAISDGGEASSVRSKDVSTNAIGIEASNIGVVREPMEDQKPTK